MKDVIRKIAVSSAISGALVLSGCGGQTETRLWVSDAEGDLGYVNVDTGEVTVVGNMGVQMTDIAFDPQGNLYGITFTQLYAINKDTAEATLIGAHNNDSGSKNSLVFDNDGTLYAAWDALYTIDVSSGMSNLIGNGGTVYRSSGDLAFHKGELYLASRSSAGTGDDLVVLSTLDGGSALVGPLGDQPVFYGLSSNKKSLYTVSGTTVYSVDPATADISEVVSFADSEIGPAFGSAFPNEAK
ncbi:MAG: hypothetical protein R3208_06825 [Ketobacteraceae bacterium]|nr:hypothetical protein [Ketobacteraceae bacterium]